MFRLALGRFGFVIGFLLLFYLAQRFWFVSAMRAASRIGSPAWRRTIRTAIYAGLAAVIFVFVNRLILRFVPDRAPLSWISAAAQLWLFASTISFLLVMVVRALEWTWSKTRWLASSRRQMPSNPERRAFFRYAGYLAGGVPLAAALYGFARERLEYTVRRVSVPVANLPAALDGMTIAQLSDIHIGPFMTADEVRRAVDMANLLHADLAVVTGDFITDSHDPLAECIAELSRLRAPLGVWGCNGNHEIYADAEDLAEELFTRHGMRLLRQRSDVVQHRGASFNLIGVDYQRERMGFSGPRLTMLKENESQVRRDMPNILLSHNPNSFTRAAELGIELGLAGHTHGGQVKVEILDHRISPAAFITSFVAGLYELPMTTGSSRLYVNRGLGTIGIPARVGVPPEITLLTLRKG